MRYRPVLPLAMLSFAGACAMTPKAPAAPAPVPMINVATAVEVRTSFICSNGVLLDVLFRNPTHDAQVTSAGKTLILYQTPTADGFRYIGGENELRGKGGEVTFKVFPHDALACAAKPATPTAGVLTGTVRYRERMALPPGMTVDIELRDISRADTAAPLIAATRIVPDGNQVPLSWRLGFDAGKIEAGHRYAVSARFTDAAGKLRWVSDTQHPVLTQGAPGDDIDIMAVATR